MRDICTFSFVLLSFYRVVFLLAAENKPSLSLSFFLPHSLIVSNAQLKYDISARKGDSVCLVNVKVSTRMEAEKSNISASNYQQAPI